MADLAASLVLIGTWGRFLEGMSQAHPCCPRRETHALYSPRRSDKAHAVDVAGVRMEGEASRRSASSV